MRRFFSDRRGNVAILFGLALIPVFGAMGSAVDYSMANAQRAAMQSAADATVLALAKIMPTSQATLNTKGAEWFNANLGTTPLAGMKLTITPSGAQVTLSATGTYQTKMVNVLRIAGVYDFPVSVKAEAKWGLGKVEVALALDNTGSMGQQNKLAQLKIAANLLLDNLQAATVKAGDTKVAIVPFGVQVKLPTSYRDAAWMRYMTGSPLSKSGLSAAQVKSSWQGCVTDRDKDPNLNYDVLDTTPTSVNATKFPGVYNPGSDCGSLQTALFLTSDWNALRAKINAMQATGKTNVTIGAVWGMHALSPTQPFSGAAAFNTPGLQKFLILLTDGDNTESRYSTNAGAIDARTALACANVKAAGIKVFSIRVIDGNATLLRNCATSPEMFFDVPNAGELSRVFSAIGAQIAKLHLSK
jgi:Flp pilus assembly protein TadG